MGRTHDSVCEPVVPSRGGLAVFEWTEEMSLFGNLECQDNARFGMLTLALGVYVRP